MHINGISFLVADIMGKRLVDQTYVPGTIRNISEFIELGPILERHFRRVWLTDNLGYRSTSIILALAAREWKSLNLGSFTTFPYGRNPLDLAVTANSIAELMPGRELVLGLSRGNLIISRTFTPYKPIPVLRETIQFLRQLQTGNTVPLADYPLCRKFATSNQAGLHSSTWSRSKYRFLLDQLALKPLKWRGSMQMVCSSPRSSPISL